MILTFASASLNYLSKGRESVEEWRVYEEEVLGET
jgi:hypothetical protein